MKIIFIVGLSCLMVAAACLGKAQPECGGMTVDKAADILGVSAQELEYRYSEMMHTCSFNKGWLTSVSFALYREKDEKTAQYAVKEVMDGLEILVECRQLDGIGDFAASCHGDKAKRLLVRKGPAWVDVLSPGEPEQKVQVAREVLSLE